MSLVLLVGCSRFHHSFTRVSQDVVLTSEHPTSPQFTWIRLLSVEPDGHTKLAMGSGETWEAMPGEKFHKKDEVSASGRGAYQLLSVAPERGEGAASRLAAALAVVPPKAQKAKIEIFVDQDGEGFLHVRVELVGPDLFVLNRAIADHAELFGTRMTPAGLDPALPLMEPGDESFSVHDTLTDCAASWLSTVWSRTERAGFRLPIKIVAHDGYGTTTPFDLSHETNVA